MNSKMRVSVLWFQWIWKENYHKFNGNLSRHFYYDSNVLMYLNENFLQIHLIVGDQKANEVQFHNLFRYCPKPLSM